MTYQMIVKTETADSRGRQASTTERVRHIPADKVEDHRNAARLSAPKGSTRTIEVVQEN
jgi:hypothetical protein